MSFNYLTLKAETRMSSINNYGTFAKQKIFRGELIAVFGGYVMERNQVVQLEEAAKHMVLQISDNQFIGSRNVSEFGDGDYINHCCEPNAGIQGQIFLEAMRDIEPGEEITFDYCMTVSDKLFSITNCKCGAKECRGQVTANDWRNEKLQHKYQGYFSNYLQSKVTSLVTTTSRRT